MTPAADEIIARALREGAARRAAEAEAWRRADRRSGRAAAAALLSLILLAHLGIMFGWMLTP